MATPSDILFFLGAGASVGAGVPDTFGLVDKFKELIKSDEKKYNTVEKIVSILEDWKKNVQHEKNGKVDIELLLETFDRLDNRDQDMLLEFFKITEYLLSDYSKKKPLKEELKDFIIKAGIVDSKHIKYLEPLLVFIAENRPIDVFSVNYDICIEQFCNTYKKEYVDGFGIRWNPELFERSDIDIRLFKLHGSVMWYRTNTGDYVKSPMLRGEGKDKLITGEMVETLVLYPMRKWEYAEPLLELLILLKKKLEAT